MILFSIFNNKKLNKKIKKWARGPRGCDVARRATWQRHADPAQRLRGAEYIFIYSFTYKYKMGLCPPLYGEGHTRINGRVLYTRKFL